MFKVFLEITKISALTLDIHSCSHYMASNMKPIVVSGAAIHVCPSWYGLSLLRFAKQLSLRSAGGDVVRHLGSKTESYVFQSFNFQVNHEVALVVRPILSVDMLVSKGVQVVFGVGECTSYIQLPDGHKIPMIRKAEGAADAKSVADARPRGIEKLGAHFRAWTRVNARLWRARMRSGSGVMLPRPLWQ